MHWRNSSIFFWSAAERFGPRNVVTRTPPPGAGAEKVAEPLPLLVVLPPLSASETAAKPTAVMPAATRESPSGPSRIVILRFFFINHSCPSRSRSTGLADHQASRA